jgi:AcrR family transcriptional regulator
VATTREKALVAALRLFSSQGYHGASMRQIASQVGVTEAALYRHFSSKRDLFEALLKEEGPATELADLEGIPLDAPMDEVVGEIARRSLIILRRHEQVARLLILESLGGDEAAQRNHSDLLARWRKGIDGVLARAQATRGIPQQERDDMAALLAGSVWGTFIAGVSNALPVEAVADFPAVVADRLTNTPSQG